MTNLIVQELVQIAHIENSPMVKFCNNLQPKNRSQKRKENKVKKSLHFKF